MRSPSQWCSMVWSYGVRTWVRYYAIIQVEPAAAAVVPSGPQVQGVGWWSKNLRVRAVNLTKYYVSPHWQR